MRDAVADRQQLARRRARCATTWSRNGIVAIADIDTRALTRVLRSAGVMRGVIATGARRSAGARRAGARGRRRWKAPTWCKDVTCARAVRLDAALADAVAEASFGVRAAAPRRRGRCKVAAYDFGMKYEHPAPLGGARLRRARVPGARRPPPSCWRRSPTASSSATAPAIPAALGYAIDNARDAGRRRRAGVRHLPRATRCSAWRSARTTYKLKFGHRGAQPPGQGARDRQGRDHVAEPRLRRRSRQSLPADVEVTHLNLNDGTVEGLRHTTQARSSACSTTPRRRPGPHDADYLFRAVRRR